MAHIPVLLDECLFFLDPQPGDTIVDGTTGSGGTAEAILERIGPTGRLIGLDRDAEAIERTKARLAGKPVVLVQENSANLEGVLDELGINEVDGVVLDLGVSSEQLGAPERGFSFQLSGPLDMRLQQEGGGVTAADLVNRLSEKQLAELLWTLGGEVRARRVAKAIARERQQAPITTTERLAAIVAAAIPARARRGRIHPATRSFQALRIQVNQELVALSQALVAAVNRTRTGGRIVVLSYHSGEDGVTKESIRHLAARSIPGPTSLPNEPRPLVRILTKKPVRPSPEEIARNPRARSARLRAAEKL